MTDCRFQTIFKEKSHLEFWCEFSKNYTSLGEMLVLFFQSQQCCWLFYYEGGSSTFLQNGGNIL